MAKTLIISGHPNYRSSVANKAILDELHRLKPDAEIVYLDALYHNSDIDIEREQKRLIEAETLVFQFPMWWYGSPSLLHRYVEDVFTHGFAYGSQGHALLGKKFILSFTTGASKDDYTPEGYQEYRISAFLPPFMAMIKLTGMSYQGSIISYGMALVDAGNAGLRAEISAKAKEHAARLVKMIGN